MVDKLKRDLKDIVPPICPTCHVEMIWSRSSLVARDVIRNVFLCSNCYSVGETTFIVRSVVDPADEPIASAPSSAAQFQQMTAKKLTLLTVPACRPR